MANDIPDLTKLSQKKTSATDIPDLTALGEKKKPIASPSGSSASESPLPLADNPYSPEALAGKTQEVAQDMVYRTGAVPAGIKKTDTPTQFVNKVGPRTPPTLVGKTDAEIAKMKFDAKTNMLLEAAHNNELLVPEPEKQPTTPQELQLNGIAKAIQSLSSEQEAPLKQIGEDKDFGGTGYAPIVNNVLAGLSRAVSIALTKGQGAVDFLGDSFKNEFGDVADIGMEALSLVVPTGMKELFLESRGAAIAARYFDNKANRYSIYGNQSRIGKTVEDVAGMAGFFAELAAGEAMWGGIASKVSTLTGGVVNMSPKLLMPLVMSTEGLNTYGQLTTAGAPMEEKIMESLKSAGTGLATGAVFSGLGELASGVGKNVVSMLAPAEVQAKVSAMTKLGYNTDALMKEMIKANPLAFSSFTQAANAAGFGIFEQTLSEVQGGTAEESRNRLLSGAATGMVLGFKDISKQLVGRAFENFSSAPPRQMDKFALTPEEISASREKAISIRDLAKDEVDPEKKKGMLDRANTIDAAADVAAVRLQAIESGEKMKIVIEDDPDLSPIEKQHYKKQIDAAIASQDPNFSKSQKISDEIDGIQIDLKKIGENEAVPQEVRTAQSAPLIEALGKKRGELIELYKNPPKPEPAKPVSIKIDSRDAYVNSLSEVSNLPKKEQDVHMALADAQAELWAKETGGKAEDWYAHTFDTVQNKEGAINRISESLGIPIEEAESIHKKSIGDDPFGVIQFNQADNKAVITIFEGADRSTRLHEDLGHTYMFRRVNEAAAGMPESLSAVKKTVDAYNTENPDAKVDAADVLSGKGDSYEAVQEYFTRGWEKWADGKFNGDKKLPKVFEQFRDWVIEKYEKTFGKITPSKEMEKLYKQMVGLKKEAPKQDSGIKTEKVSQKENVSQNGKDSQIETKEVQPISAKPEYEVKLEAAKKELAADPLNKTLQRKVKTYQAVSDANAPKKAEADVEKVEPVDAADVNKSAKTQAFFSDVVTGKSDKYKPKKPWEPILKFSAAQEAFRKAYDKFNGLFDTHIATSIPAFRDVQIKVGNAIVKVFGGKDTVLYDIGGSEGGFAKTVTSASGGKIKSINLDADPDMIASHDKTPVKGSKAVLGAFGESFEYDGKTIELHVPKEKADVVHESMTFQFIKDSRKSFIEEVKNNYLKAKGLFISEEKVFPASEQQWSANEAKKDSDFKSRYYDGEQINVKREEVLTGMRKNQATYEDYLNLLRANFKYVQEYWDGGNFKGVAASDSKAKIDAFIKEVGDTSSEFSEKNIKPEGQILKQERREKEIKLSDGRVVNTKPLPEGLKIVEGFYSLIEKKILEYPGDKKTAEQWLQDFGKTKDETVYTGIAEFLAAKKPKEMVSKEEVQSILENNRIEIRQIEKGDKSKIEKQIEALQAEIANSPKPQDVIDIQKELADNNNKIIAASSREETSRLMDERAVLEDRMNAIYEKHYGDNYRKQEELSQQRDDTQNRPEFSQWQLEGEKQDYKEILVTIPNEIKSSDVSIEREATGNEATYGKYLFLFKDGTRIQANSKEEAISQYPEYRKDEFKSAHFDEPNIVVHDRLNTRKTTAGRKVTFAEEIQSDWGEHGKKEGFKEDVPLKDWYNANKETLGFITPFEELSTAAKEAISKRRSQKEGVFVPKTTGNIPKAPWVASTPAWTKLGLKIAMREAVKQGSDYLAWTTGEQQNDRYDLSKQVDQIKVLATTKERQASIPGAFKEVIIDTPSEKRWLVIDNNGIVVDGGTAYIGKGLDTIIGKEMAKKIVDIEGDATLVGEGLKVGGKGMIGFYGSPGEKKLGIVGEVAESLWGKGSVKEVEINLGEAKKESFEVKNIDGQVIESFGDKQSAMDYASKLMKERGEDYEVYEVKIAGDKGNSKQHAIEITPEMRFEAENGMPLFQKRAEQKKIEDSEREIVRQEIDRKKNDLLAALGITIENGSTFDNKKVKPINKLLGLGIQLDQLHREYLAKPATNAAARFFGKYIGAHNVVKRDVVKVLESMVADVQLTSTERNRKEHKIGEMNRALRHSQELYTAIIKLLGPPPVPEFEAFKQMQGPDFQKLGRGDQKNKYVEHAMQIRATDAARVKNSLKRLHMVLDPDFYSAPLSRPEFIERLKEQGINVDKKSEEWIDEKYAELTDSYAKMMEAVGFDIPELKDLSPQEIDAYNALRAGLDLIHDVSFVNGHLDKETYDKYRGKYTPRLYEKYETPELSAEDNAFLSDKVVADIYNKREEVDAWKYSNVLQDPVYGLAKRYAQVMSNKAIVDYAKEVQAVTHIVNGKKEFKYIGVPDQPGYAKLGKAFGFPNETWVRKDIAEHFKGIFYTNLFIKQRVQELQNYSQLYARQQLKKFVTIYNPGVRLGNVTGNMVFASMQGISLPRYLYNYFGLAGSHGVGKGEWGDYKKIYDYLESKAVVDNKVNLEDMRGRVVRLQSMLSEAEKSGNFQKLLKVDKWLTDTYQMVDTHGKMAAFKSLVDLGLGAEEAAARVADGFQNLNRVGRAYKYGSQIPIIGPPFGAFMGDLTRIIRTGFAYNPIGMGTTIAGMKALAFMLSINGIAGIGSEEEKKWNRENKLKQKSLNIFGKQIGASFHAKETPMERFDREDRKGFPKIPMPGFIGDIPLEYKMGGNVLNLARFITPISVYSGFNDDGDLQALAARTLPWFPQWVDKTSEPISAERLKKTLGMNIKDIFLSPILGAALNVDAMGNYVGDPSVGANNEEGTLTNDGILSQSNVNRLRYLAKGYVPYGGLIDDLARVIMTGKDYYGRDRTVAQIGFRMLGYNAQIWDDSRYEQLVQSKGKTYIKNISSIIGSIGAEFGVPDADGKKDQYVGKLTKRLVQVVTNKDTEGLASRGLFIPESYYVVRGKNKDVYYKAISESEIEVVDKIPFNKIDKTQYELKRNEQLIRLDKALSDFNKYYVTHKSEFPTESIQKLMEGIPFKKAIIDKVKMDYDPTGASDVEADDQEK